MMRRDCGIEAHSSTVSIATLEDCFNSRPPSRVFLRFERIFAFTKLSGKRSAPRGLWWGVQGQNAWPFTDDNEPVKSKFHSKLCGEKNEEVWLLLIAAWVAIIHVSAVDLKAQGASCYVHTVGGDVQGSDLGASCAFLGVPFAASTADSNRWKPPQPAAPWALINATTPPAPCPQVLPAGGLLPGTTEDCLRLNIWVSDPPAASPAPVIVWLHTSRSSVLRPTLLPTRARGWPRKPERSSWRPTTAWVPSAS